MKYIGTNFIDIIGYLAAFIASIILWPLAYKTIITQDVEKISVVTISLHLTAAILWLFYGYYRNDMPVMIVQTSILFANLVLFYCYFKYNGPKAYNKLLNKEY